MLHLVSHRTRNKVSRWRSGCFTWRATRTRNKGVTWRGPDASPGEPPNVVRSTARTPNHPRPAPHGGLLRVVSHRRAGATGGCFAWWATGGLAPDRGLA